MEIVGKCKNTRTQQKVEKQRREERKIMVPVVKFLREMVGCGHDMMMIPIQKLNENERNFFLRRWRCTWKKRALREMKIKIEFTNKNIIIVEFIGKIKINENWNIKFHDYEFHEFCHILINILISHWMSIFDFFMNLHLTGHVVALYSNDLKWKFIRKCSPVQQQNT